MAKQWDIDYESFVSGGIDGILKRHLGDEENTSDDLLGGDPIPPPPPEIEEAFDQPEVLLNEQLEEFFRTKLQEHIQQGKWELAVVDAYWLGMFSPAVGWSYSEALTVLKETKQRITKARLLGERSGEIRRQQVARYLPDWQAAKDRIVAADPTLGPTSISKRIARLHNQTYTALEEQRSYKTIQNWLFPRINKPT